MKRILVTAIALVAVLVLSATISTAEEPTQPASEAARQAAPAQSRDKAVETTGGCMPGGGCCGKSGCAGAAADAGEKTAAGDCPCMKAKNAKKAQ